MVIKILNFGIVREIIGSAEYLFETKTPLSSKDLEHLLHEKFPKLTEIQSLRVAVDNCFSDGTEILDGSQEVALIPPVSGG